VKIRVYYEDTDCGNVVYYANYLKYMERSRTEVLRDMGMSLTDLRDQGFTFAVIDAHVKYRAPAVYDDLLDVRSEITEVTSITVTFQTIIRSDSGKVLVVGEVKLACLDPHMKACRIPQQVHERLRSSPGGIPHG
jgi:acyl-CoA thioester hydrolase